MKTSGRNRLPGKVTEVRIDGLMAQIGLQVGDNHVVAIISAGQRES
jgi:molybdopterin-binding protein